MEDTLAYLRQIWQQLHRQADKIAELERELQRLHGELNAMKAERTVRVGRIEYKFDQLKIETLEGTLNIGISPGLGKQIEELSVAGKTVVTADAEEDGGVYSDGDGGDDGTRGGDHGRGGVGDSNGGDGGDDGDADGSGVGGDGDIRGVGNRDGGGDGGGDDDGDGGSAGSHDGDGIRDDDGVGGGTHGGDSGGTHVGQGPRGVDRVSGIDGGDDVDVSGASARDGAFPRVKEQVDRYLAFGCPKDLLRLETEHRLVLGDAYKNEMIRDIRRQVDQRIAYYLEAVRSGGTTDVRQVAELVKRDIRKALETHLQAMKSASDEMRRKQV
jgi:hypothetical protein